MSDIGFGVIGLGMGRNHAKWILECEGATVTALADLDPERGKEQEKALGAPWHPDYREMIERPDVDVVMVCTPSGMHHEMAIAAARAGKHVLTDKPMDITLENADAMIDAARKAGVILGVVYQNRFADAPQRISKSISEGRFGKLLFGEALVKWYRSQAYYERGGWRGTWKMDGGGAIMNQGVHTVDLIQWFMGEPVRVTGRYWTLNHEMETEDTAMAIIEFDSGAVAQLLCTTCCRPVEGDAVEISVQGERGRMVSRSNELVECVFPDEGDDAAKYEPNGFANIEDFVDAVRTGRDPLVTGVEGRKSLAITLAVYESSRTGRPVEL